MATDKPAKKATKQAAVFSEAEIEAMQELKKERRKGSKANGEADLLAKIGEMQGLDRQLAERLHAIVKANAPNLAPKTWYGMPAYAGENGKVVCFFQSAGKFGARYATFGFNDEARLDDGTMWPTSFALTGLTDTDEQRIAALVRQAAG